MNDPCSILCEAYFMQDGRPPLCMNLDAVESNESMYAWHLNCEYFRTRPGHQVGLEALENRIDTISFEIDADLVEESNRMWRGRFAMACLVLVCILDIGYLFWVMT